MKTRVILGAAALALMLGGCAAQLQDAGNLVGALTGSDASPNAVYIAANSFDAIEIQATAYDKLPLCSTASSFACRTTSGTAAVDVAIRQGVALRNKLEAYVEANPGALVPVSNYNALTAVITTITNIVQAAGASK